MKEFSLEEYLKNPDREVVTRDGRKVRIICTNSDAEGGPIVAIVTMADQRKQVLLYYENGKYFSLDSVSEDDLFFAPEKHEGWMNLYKKGFGLVIGDLVRDSEEKAKKIAAGDEDYITTIKVEWEE